ncbi:hypothetical protein, partial [Pseudomonas aeruginosa]|uniref:hypothetical protein n=1 Tax=Pseudomonas aeruginosa TaxID=287 RepID=UPI0031B6C3DB
MGRYQGEPKWVEPLNSKLYSAGVWKKFCLTYAGSLLSGIEMGGTDPTALGELIGDCSPVFSAPFTRA